MKRYLSILSALVLVLTALPAAAQTRTVTGRVTAQETNAPLPNVQVVAKGTTVGVLSNASGSYTITVPAGATTLVFSAPNYGTREAAISGDVVNVTLTSTAVALEGLVVTALGQERQERSVSTSVQSIRAEQLSEARETNIVNALSGKLSGVTISNAGPQGGSSRIVIRGASSISGNNQPLFIVDGTPIDNSFTGRNGNGGVDYGNAAQDINPDDIASISVLKGPNAAALYGSRAANGVIIITTKKGQAARGLGISASQNVTFDTPLRLPTYQNQYGQGFNGRFEYVDGNGSGVNDDVDESWGPKLDGRLVCQFDSPRDAAGNCIPTPWVAQPNNIRDFFNTGVTRTTNASLSGSSSKANARLSVTRMDVDGLLPNNTLGRTTVALNGGVKATDRLSADASFQYIDNNGKNRPGTGYGGDNPMQQFIWFGRQVNINSLKQTRDADGNHYTWNNAYHNNPYWIQYENGNYDERNRIIGSASASYKLTDWLTGTVRSGTDWYRDWRKRTYATGEIGIGYPEGAFYENLIYRNETNSDFLLTANHDLTSKISLTASAGGNRRSNTYRINTEGTDRLIVPDVFNIGNSAVKPFTENTAQEKKVNSLYGSAQFAYNNYLFVDVTGRNDWSSTLPDGNNSYFYPSVSSSFIFTDAFPSLESGLLSYGKVRASWARVGNDTDPYQLRVTYAPQALFGSIPRFTVPNTQPNMELKPEETTSVEFGTELGFLDNRLRLEATYYDAKTRNQILSVPVSPTTGFTARMMNAGEIRNRGIELLSTITPVRTQNFEWNSTVNFAKNSNEVTELYDNVSSVVLGNYWSLTVEARQGERYGAFFGQQYLRDGQGNIVVNAKGVPIINANKKVLGHYTPTWTGGWNNDFRYKNLNFSFLLDTKQGGQFFSVSQMFGQYAGVLEETVKGRCLPTANDAAGYPKCDANTGIMVPGAVKISKVTQGAGGKADTTFVANDVAASAFDYYHGLYGLHEAHILDASFVKLREVKVGYNLPQSLNQRIGITSANISLVGRNLMLWTKNKHWDPESSFDAGNSQGLEFGQLPSVRSIGLNFSVTP